MKKEVDRSSKKIACLGWGSLIWDPRELPIRDSWFDDGPLLPIEFSRKSNDGRLTLVIDQLGTIVRSFWALMAETDLAKAREALRLRERCNREDIGFWKNREKAPTDIVNLPAWANARGIDAVIWTALAPRFDFQNISKIRPTKDDAVRYLKHIVNGNNPAADLAQTYIRMAPKQVDTEYRRAFEKEFGWSPY